jgi:hypothetical protein
MLYGLQIKGLLHRNLVLCISQVIALLRNGNERIALVDRSAARIKSCKEIPWF